MNEGGGKSESSVGGTYMYLKITIYTCTVTLLGQ